jgi:UDP-N-acetylglucosamine--N-acetylmuramyl-(pentapeptide) pyrophosphoryl-undecaprenol N-acetylglucosamine transferase
MLNKIIIAGGGTGGHVFPAIAIANLLKEHYSNLNILFVTANGIEVPIIQKNNFPYKNIWISGFYRQFTFKNFIRNLSLPLKLLVSRYQAKQILKEFQPQIVLGVGGYAAYPMLEQAINYQIPTVIQEQNAYPGLANRMLAPKVDLVLLGNKLASEKLESKRKVYCGNPVRKSIFNGNKHNFCKNFDLDVEKKTLLILGGSLGAKTLNLALQNHYLYLLREGFQIIWQCGKIYYEELKKSITPQKGLLLMPFIEDMAGAYATADLVVSRAGAMSVSEIMNLRKPSILVPSPNVADDHQTFNARSLADFGAAITIPDELLNAKLPEQIHYLFYKKGIETMQQKLNMLELPDTEQIILKEIQQLVS